MARPFPRTLALVVGISVTIAGCTTPIEPAADQALPAEESSTSSPATPPGLLDVALPDLGVEAPEAGKNHDDEPIQYVGPRSGKTINIGAFSRLRQALVTSGTVMG